MNLVTLWVNRRNMNFDLMQSVIDSIYVIDPEAIIGEGRRWSQQANHVLIMYIQATEKAISFVYAGLVNAGEIYVDKGVGNGVVPIEKWRPQGNAIKCRARYLYRSGLKNTLLLTAFATPPVRCERLGGPNTPAPETGNRFIYPDTRFDRRRSLRELADDQRLYHGQGEGHRHL